MCRGSVSRCVKGVSVGVCRDSVSGCVGESKFVFFTVD